KAFEGMNAVAEAGRVGGVDQGQDLHLDLRFHMRTMDKTIAFDRACAVKLRMDEDKGKGLACEIASIENTASHNRPPTKVCCGQAAGTVPPVSTAVSCPRGKKTGRHEIGPLSSR